MDSASQRPRHGDGELQLPRDDRAEPLGETRFCFCIVEVEMRMHRAIGIGVISLAAVFLCVAPSRVSAQGGKVLSTSANSTKEGNQPDSQSDAGQPQLQRRNPRYKVQHSDTLSIAFPLSPEFDQPKAVVQPDG